MKKSYIILGVILLIGLFVFIPVGAACPAGYTDECCKAYDEYQEARVAYDHCIMYPPGCTEREPGDADYDDYIKCRESSCRESRRRWDAARSRMFSLVDQGCCISNDMPRMDLTVPTVNKNTYAPGETVIVQGSVKDAKGNAIPGVFIEITVENTDISASAGTMYDVTAYSGRLDLPKDVSEGTYTVKVTASKSEYPSVSRTTSFSVGLKELKLSVKLDPKKSTDDERIKKFKHFNTFYGGETILVTLKVQDADTNELVVATVEIEVKGTGTELKPNFKKMWTNKCTGTDIPIPKGTLGPYTIKVTAYTTGNLKGIYANKTVTESFVVKENPSIQEFLDYLKELEKENPDKTWKQLIAYLHADTHPGDVNTKEGPIQLFQHGEETKGYEGVEPASRAPKWIVDEKGKRIDISHSYAGLRSDLNRKWYESKWFIRHLNTHWGDYYQVAKNEGWDLPVIGKDPAAIGKAILLPDIIKRYWYGDRSYAPTDQLRGDDVAVFLSGYYSKDSNKDKPLSEAYEYCLKEYFKLGKVKESRTNPYMGSGKYIQYHGQKIYE